MLVTMIAGNLPGPAPHASSRGGAALAWARLGWV
jgi:hypothetical protein